MQKTSDGLKNLSDFFSLNQWYKIFHIHIDLHQHALNSNHTPHRDL